MTAPNPTAAITHGSLVATAPPGRDGSRGSNGAKHSTARRRSGANRGTEELVRHTGGPRLAPARRRPKSIPSDGGTMAQPNDEVVSLLNDLVRTCEDGMSGFRLAADAVRNPDAQSLFRSRIQNIDRAT